MSVGRSPPLLQYPNEDVNGRTQNLLDAGAGHVCSVKGLSYEARNEGASVVKYFVWYAIVPWGGPGRVHHSLRE